MPKFSYTVKDKNGQSIRNVVDAASQEELITKLQKQGYFIVKILDLSQGSSPKGRQQPTPTKPRARLKPKKKKKKKQYTRKKVKLEDILSFSRQLATMIESGVSLVRSLTVIQSQIQSQMLGEALLEVKNDVERGSTLSQSIAKHPKIFNQFWVSLVEVGEASGTIPTVLNKLTFYLEQQASFRSTIISGIIYPAILFGVAVGAIAFFAFFVGPRFEEIFDSMNAELPLITRSLLAIFRYIKTNFIAIFLGITGFVFLFRKYIKTYSGRMRWEKFLFNMPQFGEVYRLIIVERFTSQMAILIDAGVPILYALDITEKLVDNNTCALIVNFIKEGVKQGQLLVTPMERSEFFPPMALQMIMVGEETGELSKMLKHVAAYYQGVVETFMKRFATIIEPFMLVFMGATIGTIVVAMFMPMFNLSQLG